MIPIPPEIDELMWSIAESDDSAAIEDFGDRYPSFRPEMAKRLQMVRSLRGARPQAAEPKPKRKPFVPSRESVPYREPGRWMMPVAAGFVLVSVVFATYAVTIYTQRQKPDTAVTQPVHTTTTAPAAQELAPEVTVPTVQTPRNSAGNTPPVAEVSPFDRPVTLVADQISLANALNLIARQIGVTLSSAPGMPDIDIAADYRNVPARQVLEDLGRNFGFTPLIQSEREALLIPAVDPNPGDGPRPPSGGLPDGLTGPNNSRTGE